MERCFSSPLMLNISTLLIGRVRLYIVPAFLIIVLIFVRFNHYDIIWAEDKVGLFRHFNGFKYSPGFQRAEQRYRDSSLRDFTFQLMEMHGLIQRK